MPAAARLARVTIATATFAIAAQLTLSASFGFVGDSHAGVDAGTTAGAAIEGEPAPVQAPPLVVPPAACLASYEHDAGLEAPTFDDHGKSFEGQGPDPEYHDVDPNYHGPDYDPHEPALDGYGPDLDVPGSSMCDGAGAAIEPAPPGSVILEPWLPMPGASRPSHDVRARV